MRKNDELLVDLLKGVFDTFIKHELFLIEKDLSERCIVHKFSCVLSKYYKKKKYAKLVKKELSVDCEYNRDTQKKRYSKKLNRKSRAILKTVIPDLVIHERGRKNNFLIAEFKKTTSDNSLKRFNKLDKKKIKKYLRRAHLLYKYGVVINIPCSEKSGFNCLIVKKGTMKKTMKFKKGMHHFSIETIR